MKQSLHNISCPLCVLAISSFTLVGQPEPGTSCELPAQKDLACQTSLNFIPTEVDTHQQCVRVHLKSIHSSSLLNFVMLQPYAKIE